VRQIKLSFRAHCNNVTLLFSATYRSSLVGNALGEVLSCEAAVDGVEWWRRLSNVDEADCESTSDVQQVDDHTAAARHAASH